MTVQFTTLFSFSGGFTGVGSTAGLITDADGNLFGTTAQGGANNYGAVIEIQNIGTVAAPIYAGAPTILVSISTDGQGPSAGLTADANGDLFGTSEGGFVFEIKNIGTVASPIYTGLTTLVTLDGSPRAGLTADAKGDLFGTTEGGGLNGNGTVFEVANTGTVAAPIYSDIPTTLVTFNGSNGQNPDSGLIANANGDLFGTTPSGGLNNYGTVFEIQNTGAVAAPIYASAPTTLVSFNGLNGQQPTGLIADANGDLFGTTAGGYVNGMFHDYGTVFEIRNTGTVTTPVYAGAPTTLVSFDPSVGEYPQGLIVDTNGDLFGTTQTAGPTSFLNGYPQGREGTVFEIQNTGTVAAPVYASAPTTLVSFDGWNGAQPLAGLTVDADGNLFGTTSGSYSFGGSVFEISGAFVLAPTISGTVGGQTTTSDAPVKPFAHATISHANAGATDMLTITLGGAGGTLADGTGFNSLGTVGGGVYTLSGTAAAITSELDALVFTPTAGTPNTSSTTTFTLSDQSSAGGPAVGDTTTSVTNSDPAVPPTIAGTVSGQATASEAPVRPFPHATVGDSNVGGTDTLTITLGGVGGTLSGTGLSGGVGGVYTLSGTAAAITGELDALVFTPKAGAPNTSSATTFTLSDVSSAGGAPAADNTTSVTDSDPAVAPTISGTVGGQTTASEAQVRLFAHVTVGDRNAGATDTLTIAFGGVGGTLSGTGLSGGVGGVYTLSGTAAAITGELEALIFTPQAGQANSSAATTFTLIDFSSAFAAATVDAMTGVIDNDLVVPPTIAGTVSGQMTTSETPVRAFAHATVGDANVGATDTLTITLGGGGGVLSGTGMIGGVGGVYTLSGTAAGINSELDALVFTPKAGAPYTSSTTTFTLSDQSSAGGGPAIDTTTTVIDKDIAPPPSVVHPNNRPVEPNNLALSGGVTCPHNFIDTLNFVASYGDLINAFGTNQQAAQNWYNTQEPIEQRVETFDGLDYVASYGDLINAFKSAGSEQAVLDAGAAHFINDGYHEGRTTTFNGLDYIASYGDLINAFGANGDAGAYHYIESGASEGRKTTFDGLDYIASYGDLINAFGANEQAGAAHFIDNGYKEGRTTTFNGLDYIASYGDLIQAFGANNDAGATHYIAAGYREGRTTTFDGLDYIASYGDLIKALGANEQAGAEHFIDNGYKEGRTTTFDGLAYIADNTDLMKAFGADNDAGANHYIDNGFSEHRSTSFNVGAYESAHPDLIGKYSSNDAFLTAYINTYKATGTFLT